MKIKGIRRILSLLLVFAFVASNSIVALASTNVKDVSLTENDIYNMANKYGYEVVNIDDSKNALKNFDSLNDLDNYLKSVSDVKGRSFSETIKVPSSILPSLNSLSVAATIYEGTHVIHWYNPFAGFDGFTLLCWDNVSLDYTYTNVNGSPRFQAITAHKSYLSGISTTWWDETGFAKNFSTTSTYNDTVKVTVNGSYVLGIKIGEFTVGLRRNDTWNCSLQLQ